MAAGAMARPPSASRTVKSSPLEPDLPVLSELVREILLGSFSFGFLIQILDAAHEHLWLHLEARGELADGGRVRPASPRLQLGDRVPRHPTPLGQLLLAHHSPLPYAPQSRKVHAPYLQNTAKNLHKTYTSVTLSRV